MRTQKPKFPKPPAPRALQHPPFRESEKKEEPADEIAQLKQQLEKELEEVRALKAKLQQGAALPRRSPLAGKKDFRDLSREDKIKVAFDHLENLHRPNGGYIAAPAEGRAEGDSYAVYWLRDIMYAGYANEYLGRFEELKNSYSLVLQIFEKSKHRIKEGTRKCPDIRTDKGAVVHARVDPTTLGEITHNWGHHQLDIFGLFLYKTGDLIKKGFNIIKTQHDRDLIQALIPYLYTVRWYEEPDFGVWEEGPELHSSSIGSALAGLTMWFDDGHYQGKYYVRKQPLSWLVVVPERYLLHGREALDALLPRESASRPYDFAQLSLIWPYKIVQDRQAEEILANVENFLVREHGVVRYPGDRYYNADPASPLGNEAQWPLGLCWLSIVHSKLAEKAFSSGNNGKGMHHTQKSVEYLQRLDEAARPDGGLPELYSAGKPNKHSPLAWAMSFYIVAQQNLLNLMRDHRLSEPR